MSCTKSGSYFNCWTVRQRQCCVLCVLCELLCGQNWISNHAPLHTQSVCHFRHFGCYCCRCCVLRFRGGTIFSTGLPTCPECTLLMVTGEWFMARVYTLHSGVPFQCQSQWTGFWFSERATSLLFIFLAKTSFSFFSVVLARFSLSFALLSFQLIGRLCLSEASASPAFHFLLLSLNFSLFSILSSQGCHCSALKSNNRCCAHCDNVQIVH